MVSYSPGLLSIRPNLFGELDIPGSHRQVRQTVADVHTDADTVEVPAAAGGSSPAPVKTSCMACGGPTAKMVDYSWDYCRPRLPGLPDRALA